MKVSAAVHPARRGEGGRENEAQCASLQSPTDAQIRLFLPESGSQEPVPTGYSCHGSPSTLPLKPTRGSRGASPVLLFSRLSRFADAQFHACEIGRTRQRCLGLRQTSRRRFFSEELHEGAKWVLSLAAVADTATPTCAASFLLPSNCSLQLLDSVCVNLQPATMDPVFSLC